MIERTTVRLPRDLLDRARRKAAAEGKSLTSLIEAGLRRAVSEDARDAAPRVLPPVSSAKGWLRNDLRAADLTNIQELDDLEYVLRMRDL